MKKPVRIGCGAGFWGDSAAGPAQLVRKGAIDFLVFDYLAEITLSILARMREKRPDAGYATDFIDLVMAPLAQKIAAQRIKVVANAGGVNPRGCRDALARLLSKLGVEAKIAVVLGDDLRAQVPLLRARGAVDLETGRPLPEEIASANAYLGARPIADALSRGADVVITGRCVDSALALGPLIASFGWSATDWDRLAMGSLAGHVIECGTQATGGLFTDWRQVEAGWSEMGFPVVECAEDGSFVLMKPPGTGGLISPATVAEQIVYEVHDPARYALPDVVCDFSGVRLEQAGPDRVRVTGARGAPAPSSYKASLTYHDGYRAAATLLITGDAAAAKGARVGEAILERTGRMLGELGMGPFRETSVEVFGAESSFGANARPEAAAAREVVVRIAATHRDERALELLSREIAPAATAMAPSISGFSGGRPRVQPIVRLWSCLVPRAEVSASVELDGAAHAVADLSQGSLSREEPTETSRERGATQLDPEARAGAGSGGSSPAGAKSGSSAAGAEGGSSSGGPRVEVPLHRLAHGRSGDKGDTCNIGIIARDAAFLPLLREQLTAARVAGFFAHFVRGEVRRYEWPGLAALNFVLQGALGGGGIASLRFDPQGKGFAQLLLEMPISVPASWTAAFGALGGGAQRA